MEVDKEKAEGSKTQTPVPSNQPASQQRQGQGPSQSQQPLKDAAPQIDLLLEASKLPLDVAIFNSARAAGGDDKIRKYLQAVLVVGGTALTPGVAHALESRYGPLFFSFCHELYEMSGMTSLVGGSMITSFFLLFFLSLLFGRSPSIGFSWDDSDDRVGGGRFFYGRLQAIATPLIQNMEKVQVIPPPKDVDKRVLTWKGASVLGRMEGATDMWVTGADWVSGEQWVTPLLLSPSRFSTRSRTRSECGQ